MEYTGIGKGKEEFIPRKSADEFFHDGEAIEELYKRTFKLIIHYSSLKSNNIIDIFNNAYQICKAHLSEQSFVIKFRNTERKDFSYAVALVLVLLHKKFYPISEESISSLKSKINFGIWRRFQTFSQENELQHPIFHIPEEDTDFVKAKEHIMASLDKAIQLQAENEELRKQLESERSLRETLEQIIKSQQEKLDIWENDSFYKAVNINTILKYAQAPENCSENDVKTIKLMLLDLCASKVPDDVIKKIKTLKCGKIITIENVAQMNTAATEITNHYHPKA